MSEVGVRGFIWETTILDQFGKPIDQGKTKNRIPASGMSFLLRAPFGDTPPVSNFYIFLFRGDYLPTDSSAASDIPNNMIEMLDYAETTRPLWQRAFSNPSSMDNDAIAAEFTFTQDRSIYGVGLVSESTKGSGNGLLLSVARYPTPKQVTAGQKATVSGGLTYISTNVA